MPTFIQSLLLYGISVVSLFAIDMVWLGVIAQKTYQKYLGSMMREPVLWVPAIAFYLIFLAGLLYFAILPGIKTDSLVSTMLRAAFFGLVAYATYDLTNLATLKNWPTTLVFIDLAWGMALSAMVSAIVFTAWRFMA